MNPILIAGLHGFVKGLAGGRTTSERRDVLDPQVAFGAPLLEEVLYRAAPALGGVPMGVSAALFAADHVVGEEHSALSGAARFMDVFAGGLLYGAAFKQFGLFGAVAAHAAHNIAIGLGSNARPHSLRKTRRKKRR